MQGVLNKCTILKQFSQIMVGLKKSNLNSVNFFFHFSYNSLFPNTIHLTAVKGMIFCKRTGIFCITLQKQPSTGVLTKKYSENMQQIYKRTPMPKEISIKLFCNFLEIALWHGCSPVNLLHIFRTLFNENTNGGLLLTLGKSSMSIFLISRLILKLLIIYL